MNADERRLLTDEPVDAVHEQNARAWDALAVRRVALAQPADDAEFTDPLRAVDGLGWLGDSIQGRSVLCLAAGGGRQSALYAAAGARVTVVDNSAEMLNLDRQVASERGFDLRTVKASMDDLSMLTCGQFEIVIHPVSTCYVPDVLAVFREVARVTANGGLYISQHKTPASLQTEISPSGRGYELTEPYYHEGPLPTAEPSRLREPGTLEFLHRWEELIGGMCRAGFTIEDLVEPMHADDRADRGAFGHRSRYVAPYVRVKARRAGGHRSHRIQSNRRAAVITSHPLSNNRRLTTGGPNPSDALR